MQRGHLIFSSKKQDTGFVLHMLFSSFLGTLMGRVAAASSSQPTGFGHGRTSSWGRSPLPGVGALWGGQEPSLLLVMLIALC